MQKIVINDCYGGFGLSEEAEKRYAESKGQIPDWDIKRDDPTLVKIVEEMGNAADGACAKLKIVEIPDDVEWIIEEYDGTEWVSEKHRTWS